MFSRLSCYLLKKIAFSELSGYAMISDLLGGISASLQSQSCSPHNLTGWLFCIQSKSSIYKLASIFSYNINIVQIVFVHGPNLNCKYFNNVTAKDYFKMIDCGTYILYLYFIKKNTIK